MAQNSNEIVRSTYWKEFNNPGPKKTVVGRNDCELWRNFCSDEKWFDEFSFQIRVEFYSISYSMATSDIRYWYCSNISFNIDSYLYYTLCSRILCKSIFCFLCPLKLGKKKASTCVLLLIYNIVHFWFQSVTFSSAKPQFTKKSLNLKDVYHATIITQATPFCKMWRKKLF